MNKWIEIINDEKKKDYFKNIIAYVNAERQKYRVFPAPENVFNAFKETPFEQVKVVIIGQDPYHEIGQAHGLAFSVLPGVAVPPSLRNIYREIEFEYGCSMPADYGCLTGWARQGVLLLNTVLTVREHCANSHAGIGYDKLISRVLHELDQSDQPIVFMLWGNNARQYKKMITNPNHLVLESVHPSPLSANRGGWFGNNHFKECNEFLKAHNLREIEWQKLI